MSQLQTDQLSASLLAANPLRIADSLETLENLGINKVHLDIMDNHYVPNLSFGPSFCEAIHRQFPQITIDVHLMTKPADNLISTFAAKGAHSITLHVDSSTHLHRALTLVREHNCKAGIALNPSNSPETMQYVHHLLDRVLIMTVNPGFGGQSWIPEMLHKIQHVRHRFPELMIEVDGGVSATNIATMYQAGAQQFVVGSSLLGREQNIATNVAALLEAV